jgi:ribonuclease P protein component
MAMAEGERQPTGRRLGLPKTARLLDRTAFDRASRGAPSVTTAHFKVVRGRGPGPAARLGLIVPRKAGGAVTRNRVKRRIREWFRRARPALPPRLDLIVIARQGSGGLSYAAVVAELEAALAREAGPRRS